MSGRDKFLTEIVGECWHEKDPTRMSEICMHCEKYQMFWDNNDFSTWKGFGKLWEWSQKQKWFYRFKADLGCRGEWDGMADYYLHDAYINPNTFADAVYNYLKTWGKNAKKTRGI